MTIPKFEPVAPNEDLWVNPDPQGAWARVAVCSRWADAKKVARVWDHKPAVVGPLRTVEGIDLFVRSLLANPQIRVVVFDGPDALPENGAGKAFWSLFPADGDPDTTHVADDLKGLPLKSILEQIDTLDGVVDRDRLPVNPVLDHDRDGGRHVLPPPPPKAKTVAPSGDPGERIVADTIDEAWPQILSRVVRFGRVVPTQYGDTKELLDLVSVIRDPLASLETFPREGKHALFEKGWAEVEQYHRFVTGPEAPEGVEYTYGSRLHGAGPSLLDAVRASYGAVANCLASARETSRRGISVEPEPILVQVAEQLRSAADKFPDERMDQYSKIEHLLRDKPLTRAAFLTPWRPDEDAGKESGRPCLVGAWFRVTQDGPPRLKNPHQIDGVVRPGMKFQDGARVTGFLQDDREREQGISPEEDRYAWLTYEGPGDQRGAGGKQSPGLQPAYLDLSDEETLRLLREQDLVEPTPVLHLTVQFRSHDMWGGWPMNLLAFCRVLVETAERLRMAVGHLVCLSMSAHLYDRTWAKAETLANAWRPRGLQLDSRSSWRFEVGPPTGWEPKPIEIGDKVRDVGPQADTWKVLEPDGPGRWKLENERTGKTQSVGEDMVRVGRNDPPPPVAVRAVAMEPGMHGSRVTAVFEGTSTAQLRAKIERSGLVTSVGNALWIGEQISKLMHER